MESALLCTLPLFVYWHWGKDYDNLCNELAFFSDCDPAANANTNANTTTTTNAHSNTTTTTNAHSNTTTNAYARSYTATNVDTDTTSRLSANKYCAAHCYGNGSCYAS
jgi:hypothetical protein